MCRWMILAVAMLFLAGCASDGSSDGAAKPQPGTGSGANDPQMQPHNPPVSREGMLQRYD